jgi:hypothetical protein
MATINYELNKKNKLAQKQIDDKLPRLTRVLAESFGDKKFVKSLSLFNAEKNTKVQYNIDTLLQ